MDGRAKPLMDRKVVGASRYLSVYLFACLLVQLFEVGKLVHLVEFVKLLSSLVSSLVCLMDSQFLS